MKVLLYQFHLLDKKFSSRDLVLNSEFGNYWNLSSKSCKVYAEKYGFDYKLVMATEEEWKPFVLFDNPQPQFEQYRSIEFLKDYDAVLYIDTDILISPNAPNIIDEYNDRAANIYVNTLIGNRILHPEVKEKSLTGVNTGCVLWYNNSDNLKNLYDLYARNASTSPFLSSRDNLKWWEKWEDFIPYMDMFENGFVNDDRFITWLATTFNIPLNHLHKKWNLQYHDKYLNGILNEDYYFIHYAAQNKELMKKHYEVLYNEI